MCAFASAPMSIGIVPWTLHPKAPSLSQHTLYHNGRRLALTSYCNQQRRSPLQVLLIHGLTYSSHEFDVDYKDYSCARSLTRNGFGVWRLDLSGYGASDTVQDGFAVDADAAAAEIATAVAYIRETTGVTQVDLLGWSWGTVTAARMVVQHHDWIRRLVLYAPIVQGFDQPSPSTPGIKTLGHMPPLIFRRKMAKLTHSKSNYQLPRCSYQTAGATMATAVPMVDDEI